MPCPRRAARASPIAALAIAALGTSCRAAPPLPSPSTTTPTVRAGISRPLALALLRRAISAHEHLASAADAALLLAAMREAGLARVVVVGSGGRTFSPGAERYAGLARNNALLLELAARHPDRLVPLVALDPAAPDGATTLAGWIARGARGLKLYSGHPQFHHQPLDAPAALPLYRLCERRGLPLLIHVNALRYGDELERVLARHPRLRLSCPHLCMLLADELPRLARLLARHASLRVDISFGFDVDAGLRLVGEQRSALRRLILRYPDRFLWGADLVLAGNVTAAQIVQRWRTYLALLASERFTFAGRRYRGLALPAPIVRRILVDNPRAWLGRAPCDHHACRQRRASE